MRKRNYRRSEIQRVREKGKVIRKIRMENER